jgi:lipoyl synthase
MGDTPTRKTLSALLRDVSAGYFPAADGGVTILPQPTARDAGVIGFTAHAVIFVDADPAWVRAQLPAGDLAGPLSLAFLQALCEHTNRRAHGIDMLCVASPLPGPPGIALMPDPGLIHPLYQLGPTATYAEGVVLAPEGRRMLRLEARNAEVPIERKPPWIKTRLRTGPSYTELKSLVRSEGLHTVCEEAGCPNIFECWEDREATFLIGGDQCTRRCDFCQIDTGKPQPLDEGEPRRVAESVAAMGLKYATVTGVARDDLPDGGAWLYAQVCREIHAAIPGCGVELLIPDFNADPGRLTEVFSAAPEVLAHNIETVPRIFRRIRPGFRYARSLDVLRAAREAQLVTKSNLILGLGEERHEITEAMRDLRAVGCELLTITQYLRPTPRHHPVQRWVKPEEFVELREEALELGFAGVMSGPLVRSSYRAGRLYAQAIEQRSGSSPMR